MEVEEGRVRAIVSLGSNIEPRVEYLSRAVDALAAFPETEEAVVYIDVSGYWSSGFDAEEMLARLLACTEFTEYEHLYTTGLSQTYLVKK